MEKKLKNLTLPDRLRNAWHAFTGKEIGSQDVLYLCDGKYCSGGCLNPDCMYTLDIKHAVNFERCESAQGDYFVEIKR